MHEVGDGQSTRETMCACCMKQWGSRDAREELWWRAGCSMSVGCESREWVWKERDTHPLDELVFPGHLLLPSGVYLEGNALDKVGGHTREAYVRTMSSPLGVLRIRWFSRLGDCIHMFLQLSRLKCMP